MAEYDDIPVGKMLRHVGTPADIPDGFLLADGTVKDKAEYPELAKIYGKRIAGPSFRLPNRKADFIFAVGGEHHYKSEGYKEGYQHDQPGSYIIIKAR